MRPGRVLCLCALLLFAAASAHAQPSTLDGVWKQVSIETDGKVALTKDAPELTISGDQWMERGLDPLKLLYYPKTEPKRIKLMTQSGRYLSTLFIGIYKLEGDTLMVVRPHGTETGGSLAFATKPGDRFSVVTYRRAAVEDAKPLAWQSDWKTAFQIAKTEGRLVFVDFFATWCGPCREMDEKVFPLDYIRRPLAQFVLLRLDVDRNSVARGMRIQVLPAYVVYDPGERERFRISGMQPAGLFAAAVDQMASSTAKFVRASSMFDEKKDVEAELLVGNTYSRLGLNEQAREAYARARRIGERRSDPAAVQLADALTAVTIARDGNAGRAMKILQRLAANPADRDTEALIWLTIGRVHRATSDTAAAIEAYRRAQSLAAAESVTWKDAAAALAELHENP